jgi:hypothetical protein
MWFRRSAHSGREVFVLPSSLLPFGYERIEKETRAPDQWMAIKKALGGSRAETEEVVCRPVLVDRVIRARFAFDQTIHAAEHQKARLARDAFLAGSTPTGTNLLRISRRGEAPAGTDEMLARARADVTGPKVLPPVPRQNPIGCPNGGVRASAG